MGVFKDLPLQQLALLFLCHLFLFEVKGCIGLFNLDGPVQSILLLEDACQITVTAIKFTPLHYSLLQLLFNSNDVEYRFIIIIKRMEG